MKLLWNLHLLIFSAHSCNVYLLLYMIPSGLSVRGSNHVFTVKRVNIGCSGYLYLVRTIELAYFNNKITKLAILYASSMCSLNYAELGWYVGFSEVKVREKRNLSEFAPLNKFNKVGMCNLCSIFWIYIFDNFLFLHTDLRKHII